MKQVNQEVSARDVSAQDISARLVDMHVQYELAKFDAEALMVWLKDDVEHILDWLKSQKLEDFVAAEQVKATIYDTVVMHKIPGAIAEIAGETALKHFTSAWHLNTPLKKIISSRQFEGFLNKLLELEQQRNDFIDHLVELPVYQELISGILYGAITRYICDSNLLSKNVPGVSSMLKMSRNMVNKALPKLGGALEENVRNYIEGNLGLIQEESKTFLMESLTEEDLRASIMDFWDAIENDKMSRFQEGMEAEDLADLVVLGYEFWLKFRKTEYFKWAYESIVDYWFEKYGQKDLSELFEDLDISSEIILREAERYAPKCLQRLKEAGQLERIIRRRIEGFYNSKKTITFLESLTRTP